MQNCKEILNLPRQRTSPRRFGRSFVVGEAHAWRSVSWDEAKAMRARGVPVALISDVVRFQVAVHEGGVVLDTDSWWLRPPALCRMPKQQHS